MHQFRKSLEIQGEVGGPEEDRTPDLLIANDTTIKDINKLPSHCNAINSGKTGGECTNRAQWQSVLTERPAISWDNLSREAYLLWFWLGVVLAVALVSWLVWDRRVQSKPSSPAPDPVRDQEWCHYPQPGDARSDKAGGARDG